MKRAVLTVLLILGVIGVIAFEADRDKPKAPAVVAQKVDGSEVGKIKTVWVDSALACTSADDLREARRARDDKNALIDYLAQKIVGDGSCVIIQKGERVKIVAPHQNEVAVIEYKGRQYHTFLMWLSFWWE